MDNKVQESLDLINSELSTIEEADFELVKDEDGLLSCYNMDEVDDYTDYILSTIKTVKEELNKINFRIWELKMEEINNGKSV